MTSEVHLIEHARRAHEALTQQIAALERVTSDRDSHPGERFWAVRQALRTADTMHDSLVDLHDRYCGGVA